MTELSTGDRFLVSGQKGTVVSSIGQGSQGWVYLVDFGGKKAALKWYKPGFNSDRQRAKIEKLAGRGAPSEDFLWPEGLATSGNAESFGYIMPLRPPEYASIPDLLNYKVRPTFSTLIKSCFHLAAAFGALHREGLCYLDISHGNAFLHPRTGGVLICDNDNTSVAAEKRPSVWGTQRFMAPEVVTGEPPSVESDLFSMGVLMFFILFLDHPLEGLKSEQVRCFNVHGMRRVYGDDPTFIYDPNDASNRPVPGLHQNAIIHWALYPKALKLQFIDLFTVGLKNPAARPREVRWERLFAMLLDHIIKCSCGAENFYDPGKIDPATHSAGSCWNCKRPVPLPPRLQVEGGRVVLLNPNTKLYPHHLGVSNSFAFTSPIGEVTQHPTSGAWGLRNASSTRWTYVRQDGTRADLESGKTVALFSGLKIDCGSGDFEVRV